MIWPRASNSRPWRRWPATTKSFRQARVEAITDEADLEEVFNTERHLLYVACTRARDHLHVSGG